MKEWGRFAVPWHISEFFQAIGAHLIPVQALAGQREQEGQPRENRARKPQPLFAAAIAPGDEHPQHVQHDEPEDDEGIPEVLTRQPSRCSRTCSPRYPYRTRAAASSRMRIRSGV